MNFPGFYQNIHLPKRDWITPYQNIHLPKKILLTPYQNINFYDSYVSLIYEILSDSQ
jgi:hypothetical protein